MQPTFNSLSYDRWVQEFNGEVECRLTFRVVGLDRVYRLGISYFLARYVKKNDLWSRGTAFYPVEW